MVVWGIGGDDPLEHLVSFRDQMGITFPILHDEGGRVHAEYSQLGIGIGASYPEDWIIGADGRVAYVSNIYDVDALIAVIEQELDGASPR